MGEHQITDAHLLDRHISTQCRHHLTRRKTAATVMIVERLIEPEDFAVLIKTGQTCSKIQRRAPHPAGQHARVGGKGRVIAEPVTVELHCPCAVFCPGVGDAEPLRHAAGDGARVLPLGRQAEHRVGEITGGIVAERLHPRDEGVALGVVDDVLQRRRIGTHPDRGKHLRIADLGRDRVERRVEAELQHLRLCFRAHLACDRAEVAHLDLDAREQLLVGRHVAQGLRAEVFAALDHALDLVGERADRPLDARRQPAVGVLQAK
ncbi:MAG: hypothetical protein IT320_16155 [Anaerolineae bacterium]|nr:hypothetical protein [Anaerolineae bacterium]